MRPGSLSPWPHFDEAEIEGVAEVLRSGKVNYWTGVECRTFEEEFANYCQVEFAVSVANGAVALELALHALGIGPADEVVVSPRTFMASVSCIVLRGAVPVFADVDPVSQTITAETIRAVLTPRTKAIIAVHLAGWPCDMDSIVTLAREHGLAVIEDCAQAHGAAYKGRPVGSLGDAAAYSFCQDKIMTTGGEGGMLGNQQARCLGTGLGLPGPWRSYAVVNASRACSGIPVAFRVVRDQLAHDGDASRHRSGTTSQQPVNLGSTPSS